MVARAVMESARHSGCKHVERDLQSTPKETFVYNSDIKSGLHGNTHAVQEDLEAGRYDLTE